MKLVDNQVIEVCYRIHYRSDVVITGTALLQPAWLGAENELIIIRQLFSVLFTTANVFHTVLFFYVRKLNRILRIG